MTAPAVPSLPCVVRDTTAGPVASGVLPLGTLSGMGMVDASPAGGSRLCRCAPTAGPAGSAAALAYVVGTVIPDALGIDPPAAG